MDAELGGKIGHGRRIERPCCDAAQGPIGCQVILQALVGV